MGASFRLRPNFTPRCFAALTPARVRSLIACRDVHDLLRQLMELAQAIAGDFERFEAMVHL